MSATEGDRVIRRILVGACMGVAGMATAAMAQPAAPATDAESVVLPSVMLVLDGSGSMWGKLGKDQKINAARDALKQALPKAAPMSLGLTTYGHRRTGDCSDVEVAVPLAEANVDRVSTYLEKYNPKGKGPLGNALKAAVEAVAEKSAKGARRSMIIVTDNADNCKIDTCELAQQIRKEHAGLVMHVIALGVSKEEAVPLACLATASGGQMFKAEGAADIAAALDQGLKLASGSAGPIMAAPAAAPVAAALRQEPAKPAPEPTGPPGLRLGAVLAPGGAAIKSSLRWRITGEPAAKGAERRVVYEGEEPEPDIDLQPGTYKLEVVFGFASAEQTVTVGPAGRTSARVALNAGIVQLKDSGAQKATTSDRVFYTLYAVGGGAQEKPRALALSSDTPPVYNLPAGTYLVAVQQGLARIERSVTVAPGALTDVDVPLYLGEVQLSAVAAEGGPSLERVLFQIFEDDPDAPGGLRELVRSSAARPEFSLPAGSYHLIARHDAAEAREQLSIKPGTRIARTLVMASGSLTLGARLPQRASGRLEKELISYRIERLQAPRAGGTGPGTSLGKVTAYPAGRGEEVSRAQAPEHALSVQAGKYRVEGRYGAINAHTVREVEVKSGATQALTLELDAGLVTLKPLVTGGAATSSPAGADILWEVIDGSGRVIWSTGQAMPRLPLAAGRYTVRADSRGLKGEQAVQVAAGDDKTVEIELK